MLIAILAFLTASVAGAVHVFAGPDHLAAVAPLAVHDRRRSWRTGVAWGFGHSGGVWLLALLLLVFRELIPIHALSTWSERIVGAVLVVIGLWGVRRALASRVHAHEHEHDGVRHSHIHLHDAGSAHEAAQTHVSHVHAHGAAAIGLLHGVAGTSHLFGILPSLALPTRAAAASYLIGFGAGAILGMAAFAGVVGGIAQRSARHGTRLVQGLMLGCSAAAIAVGCLWIFHGGEH